jgi:hypothetical protein
MRMMEEELSQLLKSHGWNLLLRKRGKRDYFYAQKWRKGEIYIASLTRLPAVTPEQVLSKLRKAE